MAALCAEMLAERSKPAWENAKAWCRKLDDPSIDRFGDLLIRLERCDPLCVCEELEAYGTPDDAETLVSLALTAFSALMVYHMKMQGA